MALCPVQADRISPGFDTPDSHVMDGESVLPRNGLYHAPCGLAGFVEQPGVRGILRILRTGTAAAAALAALAAGTRMRAMRKAPSIGMVRTASEKSVYRTQIPWASCTNSEGIFALRMLDQVLTLPVYT